MSKLSLVMKLACAAAISSLGAAPAFGGIVSIGDVVPGMPALVIGVNGAGRVEVSGGGVLDAASALGPFSGILLGSNTGSDGRLIVDGAGSRVVTTGLPTSIGLQVGQFGSGRLEITNGGAAQVNRFDATGTAFALVDGTGSKLTSASTFLIGSQAAIPGTPAARISNGGVVNAETSIVGSLNASNGALTVEGAGSALNLVTGLVSAFGRAFLGIGREQNGQLDVLAGGKVLLDAAGGGAGLTVGGGGGPIVDGGAFANASGTVTIDGAGSELRIKQVNPFANIGLQGNGLLNISNGGKLVVEETGTGAMFVGRNVGGTGTINVSGAGSELQAGRRLIIGSDANPTALLPGGTGTVNTGSGATIAATRTIVGALGTLTGSGTVVGELVNHGTVAPGNSPGIMNVLGSVTLDFDGRVVLELGGSSAGLYDQLNVRDDPATGGASDGNLNLNGLVNVTLYGGFNPFAGSFFDVFTALDITELAPIYALPALSAGLHWEHAIVSLGSSGEALRLSVAAATVPEPGGLALLAIGVIGIAAGARKRRH